MKKSFFFGLLLLFAIPFVAYAQQTWQSDLEQEKLRGRVKELREFDMRKMTYLHADTLAKFQRQGKKPPYFERRLKYVKKYDTNGYIIYSFDSFLERYCTKTYFKKGYIKEQVDYEKDGRELYRYVFDYNAQGELQSAVRYSPEKTIFTETYSTSYDNGHKIVNLLHTNADGKYTQTEYRLYPNGKLEYMLETRNGKFQYRFCFNEQGEETDAYVAKFDGNLRHLITHKEGNVLVIEEVQADGSKRLSTKKILNTYGDETVVTYYGVDGQVSREQALKYEYDSHQNWTRRETYEDGKQIEVRKREIKYY